MKVLLRQQTLTTPLLRVATDEVFIIEGAAIDAFTTSILSCTLTPKPAYVGPGCSLQSKHSRKKDSVTMTVLEEEVRCRQFCTVCHWDSSTTILSYGPSPLLNWKSPVWIMKFLTSANKILCGILVHLRCVIIRAMSCDCFCTYGYMDSNICCRVETVHPNVFVSQLSQSCFIVVSYRLSGWTSSKQNRWQIAKMSSSGNVWSTKIWLV